MSARLALAYWKLKPSTTMNWPLVLTSFNVCDPAARPLTLYTL